MNMLDYYCKFYHACIIFIMLDYSLISVCYCVRSKHDEYFEACNEYFPANDL